MKKYLALVIFAAAFFTACMTLKNFAVYEPGHWIGAAYGYGGMITVSVETNAFSILDINVMEQSEDAMIGGGAISALTETVLETDSTDIDAVSGATQTSEGFLNAVSNALSKAKIKK
jgi:fumarate reductase flavoprotein subunit